MIAPRLTRRRFLHGSIAVAGLGMLAGGSVLALRPRPPAIRRLGFLAPASPLPFYDELTRGLSELGYVEGQGFTIEYRFAEGRFERLPALAAELVHLGVDLIVTAGNPATRAAMDATSTIPIVVGITTDPVASGLIASLARPGGNVTGLAHLSAELNSKRLGLLRETIDGLSRIAILSNPANQAMVPQWRDAEQAARSAGLQLRLYEVRAPDEFPGALEAATRDHAEALLTLDDSLFTAQRSALADAAGRHRLPAMYANGEVARAGGLMSYGASFADQFRRAAVYVDKILKGAKPADLPVEQPSRFDFLINLKAAREIGLTIPPSVLTQASEIFH
jgi:putative ABC transport system substrate-binding protein